MSCLLVTPSNRAWGQIPKDSEGRSVHQRVLIKAGSLRTLQEFSATAKSALVLQEGGNMALNTEDIEKGIQLIKFSFV